MSNIRYPKELRERATRMVLDALEDNPKDRGAVRRIAKQLGIGDQSLKKWVDQARIDQGKKPGVTSAEAMRIKELEAENKELRRTNEILKAASAFFAQEADPNRRRWRRSLTPIHTSGRADLPSTGCSARDLSRAQEAQAVCSDVA